MMTTFVFAMSLLVDVFAEGGVEPVGTPLWVPAVIIVVILLLLWWGLTRNQIVELPTDVHGDGHDEGHHAAGGPGEGHDHVEEHTAVRTDTAAATVVEEPEPVTPDDLRKIEGIGPKIASVLNDAGIFTFAQLAEASVEQLNKIVREDAGITIAFPDTWPEQAALAAAGKWEELESLQDSLKGGRR
jgi:predicted flap endonuclease-1-like 5' DNA nuclease